MASFSGPKLSNRIADDVPDIQAVLSSLAKLTPDSGNTDYPIGTKRVAETTNGYEFQQYNGTGWVTLEKWNIDAQKVDGYSASTGTTANTIPVRDANGKLPGDILGNATTATKATALSDTNPIATGGTGATTAEQARINLGIPPKTHASTSTEYGAGTPTQYGHLKSHDEPDATLTADTGHAFSPAGAAAMQEVIGGLGGLLGETQESVSALDSSLRALIAEEVAKYLPLAGGTMQGRINFANNTAHFVYVDADGDLLLGGDGSFFRLRGLNSPTNPGGFQLRATDGSKNRYLIAKGEKLEWNGKSLVGSINGQVADDAGAVRICAENKGNVSSNTLTEPGTYYISGDSTNLPSGTNGYVVVEALADGTFTRQTFFRAGTVDSNDHNIYTRQIWDNGSSSTIGAWVKMLTSKDDAAVDSKSIGNAGYIRFASKLQICWGRVDHGKYTTFPKAFSAAPAACVSHHMGDTGGDDVKTGTLCSTTQIYYKDENGSGNAGRYIAFGPWA